MRLGVGLLRTLLQGAEVIAASFHRVLSLSDRTEFLQVPSSAAIVAVPIHSTAHTEHAPLLCASTLLAAPRQDGQIIQDKLLLGSEEQSYMYKRHGEFFSFALHSSLADYDDF